MASPLPQPAEEVVPGDSSDTTANSSLLAAFMTLGSIINVFVFTAQVPLMRTIAKEGDSSRYSPLPSHSMLLMVSLWLWYSYYYQPRLAFFLNNGGGLLMALFYLAVHAKYAPTPTLRRRIILTALGLMAFATVLYVGATSIAGLEAAKGPCAGISVAINISFFVSPLKALWTALKELDTTRVPVLLSVFTFLGSFSWLSVGLLIEDAFISFPNGCGFALTIVQLGILFYIRREKKKRGDIKTTAGAEIAGEVAKEATKDLPVLPLSSSAAAAPTATTSSLDFPPYLSAFHAQSQRRPVVALDESQHAALVKAHWAELGVATESLFAKLTTPPADAATATTPRGESSFSPVFMTPEAMDRKTINATSSEHAAFQPSSSSSSASTSILFAGGSSCDDDYGRITSSCCLKDEARALKQEERERREVASEAAALPVAVVA